MYAFMCNHEYSGKEKGIKGRMEKESTQKREAIEGSYGREVRKRETLPWKRRNKKKGRDIERCTGGTVTNKYPQHDSLLPKHFIFPQHNGVLLPIICSVIARVDIK
jgi:hypothetical protein